MSPFQFKRPCRSSVFALLHELGPRSLRDEDFAEMYTEGKDRPSVPTSFFSA